jgi:hypothetical protein
MGQFIPGKAYLKARSYVVGRSTRTRTPHLRNSGCIGKDSLYLVAGRVDADTVEKRLIFKPHLVRIWYLRLQIYDMGVRPP